MYVILDIWLFESVWNDIISAKQKVFNIILILTLFTKTKNNFNISTNYGLWYCKTLFANIHALRCWWGTELFSLLLKQYFCTRGWLNSFSWTTENWECRFFSFRKISLFFPSLKGLPWPYPCLLLLLPVE